MFRAFDRYLVTLMFTIKYEAFYSVYVDCRYASIISVNKMNKIII